MKNNSLFLGNVIHKNLENSDEEITLNIKINLCKNSHNFILTIVDSTEIIKSQEIKSEKKLKNLFMKKFSHEFKNPLLNIREICSHFSKSFISKSGQDMTNLSKMNNSNCYSNFTKGSFTPSVLDRNKSKFMSSDVMSNYISERKTILKKNQQKKNNEISYDAKNRGQFKVLNEDRIKKNVCFNEDSYINKNRAFSGITNNSNYNMNSKMERTIDFSNSFIYDNEFLE